MSRAPTKKESHELKTEVEDKEQTKAVVATKPTIGPPVELRAPAELMELMGEGEARGVSTRAEDNIVPMIKILQGLSPQVNKRSDDYIEGAEVGEIWLKNAAQPIRSGVDGIVFQPCAFSVDWVEWKPKRAGYAGRHDARPADAKEKEVLDDNGEPRIAWVRPNGNIVVETRYHFGLVDGYLPYVIPLSGTGHTFSRSWMTLINQFKKADGVTPADSFARTYRLRTKTASNDRGEWMTFVAEDLGWVTVEQYKVGLAFHKAVLSGEKKAEVETPDDMGGSGGSAEKEARATRAGI